MSAELEAVRAAMPAAPARLEGVIRRAGGAQAIPDDCLGYVRPMRASEPRENGTCSAFPMLWKIFHPASLLHRKAPLTPESIRETFA